MIPNVLTIAGTDPSGGAGIQADLKTFSALGVYGMSVVTALVAQTTTGVHEVMYVPAEFVTTQLEVLFADVRVDAVKIGMLANADVIRVVADCLHRYRPAYVVLDPVMVAKSGDTLLEPAAVESLVGELMPAVDLVTPNLDEAAVMLGEPVVTAARDMPGQAERVAALGAKRVLLKGGHLADAESTDILLSEEGVEVLRAPRIATDNDHGTGCTLSAAIAALRPSSEDWRHAVVEAKDYLTGALAAADQLDVGRGHGPVHHFYRLWVS
ncbi:MAG TPA: bifunctional hydroxymethylpyrimidine kinase/phosphomethylpyrimidine kinase [Acidimicrobiales bacterium]|nr:bifunctional hydroxymethylpyrimidine kinase/phosphomethylpyrimidine kinase [Acidimicrobiales bacterium]